MAAKTSVKVKKSESFKQIYSIGANGGFTPFDFRIGFYNDIATLDEGGKMSVDRVIDVEIIMSPVAAKSLVHWLNGHIEAFEKQFGPISVSSQSIWQNKTNKKDIDTDSSSMWT
jgi:hypothetical protein